MAETDEIDLIMRQWARERPDLDPSGFEIVGRVLIIAEHLRRRVGEALAPFDLSLWAFDVLATLRRQGAPFRLTPTELSQATMLTSGAMTNRLDRLEAAGMIVRERNPDDRRGVYVVLTEEGREVVDRALGARFAEAADAVREIAPADRARFADLLRELLRSLDRGI